MRFLRSLSAASTGAVACLLAGCGGGGLASAPPPQAAPVPAPSPSPSPSAPIPPPFNPTAAKLFADPPQAPALAVAGKGWTADFEHGHPWNSLGNLENADGFAASYDAATGTYRVTVPKVATGTLFQVGAESDGGYGPRTGFAARIGQSAEEAAKMVNGAYAATAGTASSPYSYVTYVGWYASDPITGTKESVSAGVFGVAQPTPQGAVPLTGTARYTGDVLGMISGNVGDVLHGTAQWDFDFAAGTLSGSMKVTQLCGMGCLYDATFYDFANVDWQHGATSFSGKLRTVGAPGDGSFSGLFAGPRATELMAGFQAPYFDNSQGIWATAGGAMLGKRD